MQIQSLLIKAISRRTKLFEDPGTNCCRIFNSEGDGVPGLCIDRYDEYLLVQYYEPRLHSRGGEILRAIEAALPMLPAPPKGILLKDRNRPSGAGDIAGAARSVLLSGSLPPDSCTVRQNGVLVAVDLLKGQNTGIFLDMREVRNRLAPYYSRNDIMLNLFSYTALFSVHALIHGITGATNVDLSKGVLERAKTNYRLNGLRIDERDFVYGDSLEWIRRFRRQGKAFSFVIFDPPTFSRNRKRTFSTKKNYRDSLALVSALVPSGLAFTSINSYSISREEYLSYHPEGWRLEFFANESSDFTHAGNPYLKAGLWNIKNS
ncbi:MAG: class I SAM-dependent rRNA methyltransferase [Spirochaetes bacterium]|nr:class I SAM-dependent rRNA methyltransferase [Spirochaetota bacterium]